MNAKPDKIDSFTDALLAVGNQARERASAGAQLQKTEVKRIEVPAELTCIGADGSIVPAAAIAIIIELTNGELAAAAALVEAETWSPALERLMLEAVVVVVGLSLGLRHAIDEVTANIGARLTAIETAIRAGDGAAS